MRHKLKNKARIKLGIKSKILMSFCFSMLLVLISQMTFNVVFAKSYYTRQKAKVIEKSFYEIKKAYTEENKDIKEIIADIEEVHGLRIIILGSEDLQQMERKSKMRLHSKHYFNVRASSFVEKPIAKVCMPKNIKDEPLLRLTGKFQAAEEVNVLMFMPIEAIDSSVKLLNEANIGITIIAIGAGLIFFMLIVQTIIRPIKSVENVSKSLSNLDFSKFADESSSIKELSSLAVSINSMSNQLQDAIEGLRQANKELQKDVDYQKQIEKMRREFIANVSHEMKTPLSLLQLYSENLKENVEGIDRAYYCETIIEETTRLSEMVKSMLDISAIENGLSKMNMEPLDFSTLCRQVVEKMMPILEGCKVLVQIEDNLNIIGDCKYLEQAIKNYISNAVSYTAKGKCIRIRLVQIKNQAAVFVFNEGKNIAEEDMPYIWESFYKSDKSRTRSDGSNAGQGLYIVKTIIEKHNGTYGVSNMNEGVEFKFLIPLKNL